jgi:hypothetical protein
LILVCQMLQNSLLEINKIDLQYMRKEVLKVLIFGKHEDISIRLTRMEHVCRDATVIVAQSWSKGKV